MLTNHLGVEQEIDPKQAAVENSIVKALRRKPLRQNDLWYRAGAARLNPVYAEAREKFFAILDGMVQRRVITRETTNRTGKFLYRMSQPLNRSRTSMREPDTTINRGADAPLTPEAA